jgi:hypothetical protein
VRVGDALRDGLEGADRPTELLALAREARGQRASLLVETTAATRRVPRRWALRAIGTRSRALNREAVALAQRLAAEPAGAARWIGKDALKALTKPALIQRLSARTPPGTQ